MNRVCLVSLLSLGACTSVLGIEDLHDGPRPGTGGDESSAGMPNNDAGKTGNNGGKSNGGSNNPTAGSANPDAGAGSEATGGTPGSAGDSAGGDGTGGAPEPNGGKVTGKVVDRFGIPVGSVPVQIGASLVMTNDKGVFTVEDVPATYEVSLVVYDDGYVFQGLTRRDPTLQLFQGHLEQTVYVDVTSAGATLGANDQLTLSAGMPTGTRDEYTDIGVDSSVSYNLHWEGGPTSASTIHGLEWTKNAATKLPATYKAYDSKPLALMAGVDASLSLNMAAKTITSGVVTGTVTPRTTPIGGGYRTNAVFVRFSSGASIQVVDNTPTVDAFSYVVPTLANSSITVAAWEGSYEGPLGMVHKDGLSPGAATGALAIPAPPKLLKPLGSTVDEETTAFTFQASPDNAGAFVVILNSLEDGAKLYIVTSEQKLAHLPTVVDGSWTLQHASGGADQIEYEWWVETHGSFATVDAMTGPDGYFDEFGVNFITPVGIHQQDGTYTYSSTGRFVTKNQ